MAARRDYRPGQGPVAGLVVAVPAGLACWAAIAAAAGAVFGWW